MELVPAALETRCLILLPAAPGLAPAVLDYYLRNAAFLAPFEPERPAGFYTAEHHARELAADVQRAAQGTGVRFYLALKDVPGRVIGSVALNNIVRGAFQSCFLGYKLDGALCGRGYMTQAVGSEMCIRDSRSSASVWNCLIPHRRGACTVRPVSSRISRVTACTKESPFSTWPPGSV